MIFDELTASRRYEGLGPRFAAAFRWLRKTDPDSVPEGEVEVAEGVVAEVVRRGSVSLNKTQWQAHRRRAEIHYLARGREAAFRESLGRAQPGAYDATEDLQTLDADAWADLEVEEGQFLLFFPEDAYRVGIRIDGADPVTRVVVQVRLD